MDFLETITGRNEGFASSGFVEGLKMLPYEKTVIIGCVDPRVDPADLFDLKTGEAVVIRNVGGRINTALLETMAILRTVAGVAGKPIGDGWNLIVLHHTDCGIIPAHKHAPELLAKHLNVTTQELEQMAIDDPYEAVRLDVAALKANPNLPAGFMVSGVVYDVADGKVETIVPPTRLREEAAA
ncbi:carbonic anhydrase [Sphingobium amiense]|uniref:Carbonic anhydrase n=1 Tax=Sphingobium amiense TaxID=135719 RepID=A0A494W329_9SPHN|nr:carbonic anhydrase [Sphingobium amiense]BBD97017.1 carbonic anhydrase [Sphingobium amiense]